MLKASGFVFEQHKKNGIPHDKFAYYFIESGLILNDKNHWITFHGGMDFGYLYRLFSGKKLPKTSDDFKNELDLFFVNYYDCKEIKKELTITGSLKNVAKELGVDRIGTMHQAGSDAQVTLDVYFKLRQKVRAIWNFDSEQDITQRLKGKVYGVSDTTFNEDSHYLENYKTFASKSQFTDSTGYVNLRMLHSGKTSSTPTGGNSHSSHQIQHPHSSSAGGMLSTQSMHFNNRQSQFAHTPTMEMDMGSSQGLDRGMMNSMHSMGSQQNMPQQFYSGMMQANSVNLPQQNFNHEFVPQAHLGQLPNPINPVGLNQQNPLGQQMIYLQQQQPMMNQAMSGFEGDDMMGHQQNQQFNRGMVMHPQMQGQAYVGNYNQGNFSYQQQ